MKRIVASLYRDITFHKKYGFYYAAIFITVVWIVIMQLIPGNYLDLGLPFIIFEDLGIVGFYFIAGQILFEKNEQTLYALIITPLTFFEYLFSKLVTLTFLALIISFILVIAVYGFELNPIYLFLGIVVISLLALLVGMIGVSPYNSISTFILPSQLYLLVLNIPLIDFFGIHKSFIYYLVPTQGCLILLKAAFLQVETWQLLYAIIYPAIWIVVLIFIAKAMFERYIIASKGGV